MVACNNAFLYWETTIVSCSMMGINWFFGGLKQGYISARLGTHLNADWLIEPQCPYWPSSTNA